MIKQLLKFFWIMILLFTHNSYASDLYYSKIFGHIHLKPYASSSSVTGISCGEKVAQNLSDKNTEVNWEAVSFGDKKGYIYKPHLVSTKPDCMQAQYPIFFQALELDLTEIFLWGKLNDQYIEFETGQ